ncbi:MAG TPA: hypothetical protein VFG34_08730 [Sphingopyxis sp.]|nr:hypothetical protein [Sphingopyxis sp.]
MIALKRAFVTLILCQLVYVPWAQAEPDRGHAATEATWQRSIQSGAIVLLNTSPADDTEIVITADRWGETKVEAESEYEEAEIASHGADSIQDLLTRLSPFIDPRAEEPIILINGKPAGLDVSVLSYPTEALQRVAVLKPEAAAQYGEAAGKRVVNLVLKKHFSMMDAGASANLATAGGQYGGSLSAGLTQISGHARWNVQARVGADSDFLKSARNLPPRDGVFDSVGFISAPDGGEIDPALSLAAGELVTVAALPQFPLTHAPSPNDFVGTANRLNPLNPNRFETLQSSRRNASLRIGVTRPVGNFSVSLNVNASRSSSEGLRGLPMASVLLPAGYSMSPFAGDVMLTRPFAGEQALRTENGSTSLNGTVNVNGNIGSWQTSLGLSYSRGWSNNLLENGVDIARVQSLVDGEDPAFNPFGLWGRELLSASRNRSRSENLTARFNVRKTILDLPAGSVAWNVTANTSRNNSHSRRMDAEGALVQEQSSGRSQSSGQTSLSIPLARRGGGGLDILGDLSVDVSASMQTVDKSRPRKQYGSSVNWSPWSVVQLRGSVDYTESSPSFEQLDGAILTTVNRVFDYERQEMADVIWLTGGNSNLGRGSQQNITLAATIRPLGNQALTLNFGYQQLTSKGAVSSFPELTPAIEAAFPERITRDADGRLTMIDARAINIEREHSSGLSSGLAFRSGTARSRGEGAPKGRAAKGNATQFSVSLNHRMALESELLTRSGVDVIDQLRGGGRSRHNVSLQTSIGRRGMGASLNGNWSSPARLRNGAGGGQDFLFKPPMTFNFSTFAEPEHLFPSLGSDGIWSKLKISVDVQNLLNGYRRVRLADGSIPAGYSREEVDPLGRSIRINLRKRF